MNTFYLKWFASKIISHWGYILPPKKTDGNQTRNRHKKPDSVFYIYSSGKLILREFKYAKTDRSVVFDIRWSGNEILYQMIGIKKTSREILRISIPVLEISLNVKKNLVHTFWRCNVSLNIITHVTYFVVKWVYSIDPKTMTGSELAFNLYPIDTTPCTPTNHVQPKFLACVESSKDSRILRI